MVYASLIVILVFVPVFFLEGLSGSFFRPLALAYVLAIVASLLVAPDRHAGPVAHAPDRAHPSGVASRRWCGCSRRSIGAILPPLRAGPAGRSFILVAAFVATGWAVARAGRGVPARLPGERLPDALDREAGHVAGGHAADHGQRQQGAAQRRRASATSARTSAGPRSPTRSSARTSPSSGSASTPRPTTPRPWRRSRRSSTAIPAYTRTC